jgi:prolyl-tRNA synthetase
MGSFGIGVSRLLGCIAETCRDDVGLVLPVSVAPFQVHLVALTGGDTTLEAQADALYDSLQTSGLDVLYDDRDARAGVKFNDADLLGVPVRLTLGRRSLEEGGVELKLRAGEERSIVALADVEQRVHAVL